MYEGEVLEFNSADMSIHLEAPWPIGDAYTTEAIEHFAQELKLIKKMFIASHPGTKTCFNVLNVYLDIMRHITLSPYHVLLGIDLKVDMLEMLNGNDGIKAVLMIGDVKTNIQQSELLLYFTIQYNMIENCFTLTVDRCVKQSPNIKPYVMVCPSKGLNKICFENYFPYPAKFRAYILHATDKQLCFV